MYGVSASSKVFPESMQLLDEYHSNKNQLKNCASLNEKSELHVHGAEANNEL